jgi:hypothetical protein
MFVSVETFMKRFSMRWHENLNRFSILNAPLLTLLFDVKYIVFRSGAGPSGRAGWVVGIDGLDAETVGSSPA